MKTRRFTVLTAAFVVLGIMVTLGAAPGLSSGSQNQSGASATVSSLTPAPGNPLRKAVLNALRQELQRLQGVEVVFVVRHIYLDLL